NGLQFSTMAGQTGGGKQVVGFLGIGVNYFRSPKFIEADGGWDRVVWMPKMLKDKVVNDIPEDIRDKIATEEDAADVESLRNFLKDKEHPILERWVEEEEEAPEEEEATEAAPQAGFAAPQMMQMPGNLMPSMPMMGGGGSGGVKIVLKNAKVSIEKVIIKKQD
ncbi:MAG: acetyl-CoA decarbonylase/synthase, complex subunit beta, partial [Methanolobus sp.]|nr:acetyl-CoA decarbonylase/synthase, complex subunit beta [Methanolobus sp.]